MSKSPGIGAGMIAGQQNTCPGPFWAADSARTQGIKAVSLWLKVGILPWEVPNVGVQESPDTKPSLTEQRRKEWENEYDQDLHSAPPPIFKGFVT